MTLWVVDTSPLIFLAKLDRLDLLRQSADVIYIPNAVWEEVRSKSDAAYVQVEEATGTWLKVQPVANTEAVELLLADLDWGEAETIVLAKTLKAERIVLDDLDARRFARRAGLRPVGTLGLLLAARLRGDIPSVRIGIDRLQAFGFRATSELIEAALQEAGEI